MIDQAGQTGILIVEISPTIPLSNLFQRIFFAGSSGYANPAKKKAWLRANR